MMRRLNMLVVMGVLLSACSLGGTPEPPEATQTLPGPTVRTMEAPDPEATARVFLDAWQAEDYETMYAMLSPLTQDAIGREDFTARYEDITTQAAITGMEYQIVSSLLNPESAQVRYRVTLTSAAVGQIVRETFMDLSREGDEWRVAWSEATILPELAGGNGLQLNLETPVRGNIYDHSGLAFAVQMPEPQIVALWLVPNQIGDEDAESAMLGALSRLLDRRPESIEALYDDIRSTNWRVNLGEVTLEEFQREQGILAETGGVQWSTYTGRYYVGPGLAPHAVGWVGQIQQEQLDEFRRRGYPQDAFVGQSGLESVYEQNLRGRPGGTLYLTDPEGNRTQILAERAFEPPFAVYSTLDRELQRHVRNAISGFSGAAVVIERDTGRVLAMASSPDFDPNLFDWHNPNSASGLQEIFNRDQPLVNRATSGVYPLGSLFKIVSMAAALESDLFEPDTIYNCQHTWTEIPGVTLYDWTFEKELPAQGEITLSQGLTRSCNPWFYHIGLELFQAGQPGALSDMARAFGLGERTGFEIDEAAGSVPGPDNSSGEWKAINSVQLAIGQDALQATPLQAARYLAALGNGGTLYRPQLVDRLENPLGETIESFEPEVQGTIPVSQENLEAIQNAMVSVVRADKGTARRRFLGLNINLAGKTGTAQTTEFGDPHSWFGAYTFEAREDTPDIAVVVILEGQGEGSEWAAPVIRRILEAYFFGRPISLYPWESQIGVERTETPTPEGEEGEPEGTPEP